MHALHAQFEPLGTVAVARVDAGILELLSNIFLGGSLPMPFY